MKSADVCLAVLVAVIWGLAFVASRLALGQFLARAYGIAVMLLSKRPQVLPGKVLPEIA